MNEMMLPFGETVLAWRVARGMSQAALALKAGVPRPNLSDIERGKREVGLGTLRALAAALGVRPGVLADGEGPGRGEELSREALERIARAAARSAPLSDAREQSLARHLRAVLAPQLDPCARLPARRSDRAWLALRASLPKEVIASLARRALEKAPSHEPRAD